MQHDATFFGNVRSFELDLAELRRQNDSKIHRKSDKIPNKMQFVGILQPENFLITFILSSALNFKYNGLLLETLGH